MLSLQNVVVRRSREEVAAFQAVSA